MLKSRKSLIIAILSIYTIGTVMSYGLLYPDDGQIEDIDQSQIYLQRALGQSTAQNNTNQSNHSISSHPTDKPDNTFYRQGLVSSTKSGPNETAQVALILPHRPDGMIYSGVLTYSASSPVEIGLLSRISVDNATLSQIINQFGNSSPNWIDSASSIHNLTQAVPQIIAGIQPDYGSSTPYYSASIPFVASGVGLWSPVDKPFLVSYQLSAKLIQPEIVNNVDLNQTD
jgi:hypothetical protein